MGICAPVGVAITTRCSCVDVIAKVAAVADVDGIAFAAFDVFGDVFAADAGGDRPLHVRHGQPIARRFGAVDFDIDVKALRDALGEDGAQFGNAAKNLLQSARPLAGCPRRSGPGS